MYNVPPAPEKEPRVILHHIGGSKRVYENLEDMCNQLDLWWIKRMVGLKYGDGIKIVTRQRSGIMWDKETRKITWAQPEEFYHVDAEYIIRTEDGEKLTPEDLEPVYWRIRARGRHWGWRNSRDRGAKRSCYGGYRNPKTSNERRQAFQDKDENEPPIRARRNFNNIITAWDDRTVHSEKSWKLQSKRKRQYRPM